MSRYDDLYKIDNKIGIPLSSLKDELHNSRTSKPKIPDLQERFKEEPFSSYIKEMYEYNGVNHFKFEDDWHHLPYRLFDTFTTDEKCRLTWNACFLSDLTEMMEVNPRYQIFTKVRNCLWQWGTTKNYNVFVNSYNAIRGFDFGVDGFDTYLDHTTYFNDRGYSKYTSKYLDGVFAYMIHYKGKHVMTIGFSVSKVGLLIQQIQMVQPKGNRWLYKLDCHYIDYVIKQMAKAFDGWKILFIDGISLAQAIQRSYGKDADKFTEEKQQHVVKIYQRKLSNFRRAGYKQIRHHRYHYLHAA